MELPPTIEQKFKVLIGRYPVKRSALIPMMLYAQDHFGFLSDEVLEEIARRLGLNLLQVTETLAYYSMLRRKPAGRPGGSLPPASAQPMHAVGEQDDQHPLDHVEELGRVAHGRSVWQRIEELVERRETAKTH